MCALPFDSSPLLAADRMISPLRGENCIGVSRVEALGTPDFIRARIGMAHPAGSQGSIDYLLQPLTDQELRPLLAQAGDAVLAIIARRSRSRPQHL